MKYLLLFLSLIGSLISFSQTTTVTVKFQKQTLTCRLDDDNNNKVLIIDTDKKPLSTDKLVVYNNNAKELKEWKRTFTIFNADDEEVITLKAGSKAAVHELPIKVLLTKLSKNRDYTLYTIALPKDPAKAAVIRVRRILICTIRVK